MHGHYYALHSSIMATINFPQTSKQPDEMKQTQCLSCGGRL